MGFDPLSPIAPARPRALLVPAGKIRRARFMNFVQQLQAESVVRLGDVTPDKRQSRTMFSPLASPTGIMIYNISTALPPESHLALSPFEVFREPLLVIGIADNYERNMGSALLNVTQSNGEKTGRPEAGSTDFEELLMVLEDLRAQYPKALVHEILLFECTLPRSDILEGFIAIPPESQCSLTTIKTVMCDITSLFLAEMTTYAKSLQALSSIESPGLLKWNQGLNGRLSFEGDQMNGRTIGTNPYMQHRTSRTQSPSGATDKGSYRMSMPANPSAAGVDGSNSFSGSRPATPPSRTQTPPPTTFDQITEARHSFTGSPGTGTTARPGTGLIRRDSKRESVPVHGFGSGSLSEQARNKGRGRVGLVVASLYLLCGRWEDAVRESVEGASTAKANGDYLWHAKGLENILVGLVLIAWAGLDFQIPQICYPIAEKSSASPPHSTVPNRMVSLQNLANLLPDLVYLILSLYDRVSTPPRDYLPQIVYSESVIRFTKILSAVHLSGGRLSDDTLQLFVLNIPLSRRLDNRIPRVGASPSRIEISSILFRAMPPIAPKSGLSTTDKVTIYAGIASVLTALGLERKRALVLRELVSTLIPGLVQARRLGAAEKGLHPAAELAVLDGSATDYGVASSREGEAMSGLEELLAELGRIYGVVSSKISSEGEIFVPLEGREKGSTNGSNPSSHLDNSNEGVIACILRQSSLRSFGNQILKLNVLRHSISLCEALPDFHGVLRFTSELLRTAGSGIAPKAGSHAGSAYISREEQVRLATIISKTVNTSRRLGLPDTRTDYWDEFLVRDVELVDFSASRKAIPRQKRELDTSGASEEALEKTPFIYNPFLKRTDGAKAAKIVIAGEHAEFRITLQNLYDFEIEIEQLMLDTDGVDFEAMEHSTIVGPYRKQTMVISGIPKATGPLKVTGCIVRVQGCWERRFPIFSTPWTGEFEYKIQDIGLAAARRRLSNSSSNAARPVETSSGIGPEASFVSVEVVDCLPLVTLKSTSLSQNAMMVLEGETRSFFVNLQNVSSATSVNALLFSYGDSTTAQLQDLMRNKDISHTEMYELELLVRKHAFKWKRSEKEICIEPGQVFTAEVEIIGKSGLTGGVIQWDYTHLGDSLAASDKFYTRQITLPLTVTVNASIELIRADILSFPSDIGFSELKSGISEDVDGDIRSSKSIVSQQNQSLSSVLAIGEGGTKYCLLLLDLRNSWPTPLKASIQVRDPSNLTTSSPPIPTSESDHDEYVRDVHTSDDVLQPGHITRFVLPLPRILLRDSYAPIPIFDPANRRQFVVNSSKTSYEAERLSNEAFWYREALLKLVHGSWEEADTGRKGVIELRGIRLNSRMIEAVKVDELEITLAVAPREDKEGGSVHRVGRSQFRVLIDEFISIKTKIVNRTSKPVHPLLRLQPSLRNQPQAFALNTARQFLCNGLMQKPLPLLASGETVEVDLAVCLLCQGEFEVMASVEETRVGEVDMKELAPNKTMDRSLKGNQRRIWHARAPCVIIACEDKGVADGQK